MKEWFVLNCHFLSNTSFESSILADSSLCWAAAENIVGSLKPPSSPLLSDSFPGIESKNVQVSAMPGLKLPRARLCGLWKELYLRLSLAADKSQCLLPSERRLGGLIFPKSGSQRTEEAVLGCVCIGNTNPLPRGPQGVLSPGRTVQMSPEELFELEGLA